MRSSLQEFPNLPNGRCICLVNGVHRSLVANIGAALHFSLEFVLSSGQLQTLIKEAGVIYVEGFFIVNRMPICLYLIEGVQKRIGKFIAYNLSACYICEDLTNDSGFMAENADIVFGNSREFETFGKKRYNLETAEECALRLHELWTSDSERNQSNGWKAGAGRAKANLKRFGKILVVTNDCSSVLIVWGKEKQFKEVVPVKKLNPEDIVDTTGAGDAFVGGFLYSLMEGRGPRASGVYGNLVAAATIAHMGAEPPRDVSAPALAEVSEEKGRPGTSPPGCDVRTCEDAETQ